MSNRIKLLICFIVVFSIIHGMEAYEQFKLVHKSPTGNFLDNYIELPEFEDIFVPAKGR